MLVKSCKKNVRRDTITLYFGAKKRDLFATEHLIMKALRFGSLLLLLSISRGYADSEREAILTEEIQQYEPGERDEFNPTVFDQGYWMLNKDQKTRIGGLLDLDARFFTNRKVDHSTFLVRRARLFIHGELQEIFGYLLMGKWDFQIAQLQFAWIDSRKPEYLRFRLGLTKQPFGLESTYSGAYWDIYERSIGSVNFIQARDLGAMLFGEEPGHYVQYGFGIFNGRVDRLPNTSSKDFVGRVIFLPFRSEGKIFTSCDGKETYSRLSLGMSIGYRKPKEDISRFVFITDAETPFWRWAGSFNSGTVLNNHRQFRWGADLEWLYDSFSFRAEYLNVYWGKVGGNGITAYFSSQSGYIQSSYFLTGEIQTHDRAVIPKRNLNIRGGMGAWQVAARYQLFDASSGPIQAGLASGSNRVWGPTLALNWFFNPYMLARFDWDYMQFNQGLPNDPGITNESVFIARWQVEF